MRQLSGVFNEITLFTVEACKCVTNSINHSRDLTVVQCFRHYTPGRGKIVPRNIITLLVGEKLCRVNYTPGRGKIVPRK